MTTQGIMEKKERLTNEKLLNKFNNQFELVNYAIKLAENMIRTGRAPRVRTETQNSSLNVLAELSAGKDVLEEITYTEVVANDEEVAHVFSSHGKEFSTPKSEKKKSRILQS